MPSPTLRNGIEGTTGAEEVQQEEHHRPKNMMHHENDGSRPVSGTRTTAATKTKSSSDTDDETEGTEVAGLISSLREALNLIRHFRGRGRGDKPDHTTTTTVAGRAKLNHIPSLINRTIPLLQDAPNVFGPKTCFVVTELVMSIIVEFSEPYLMDEDDVDDVSRKGEGRRADDDEDKKKKRTGPDESINNTGKEEMSYGCKGSKASTIPSRRPINGNSDDNAMTTSPEERDQYLRYKRRVQDWSVTQIAQLLRPSPDLVIPQLDAFLASTGANDGLDQERALQHSFHTSLLEWDREVQRRKLELIGHDRDGGRTLAALEEEERAVKKEWGEVLELIRCVDDMGVSSDGGRDDDDVDVVGTSEEKAEDDGDEKKDALGARQPRGQRLRKKIGSREDMRSVPSTGISAAFLPTPTTWMEYNSSTGTMMEGKRKDGEEGIVVNADNAHGQQTNEEDEGKMKLECNTSTAAVNDGIDISCSRPIFPDAPFLHQMQDFMERHNVRGREEEGRGD